MTLSEWVIIMDAFREGSEEDKTLFFFTLAILLKKN